MMVSLFLAKAFGIYFVITGLALLLNSDYYLEAAMSMIAHKGLQFLSAFITLFIGIVLVLFHNIWVMNWRVIITILSWLTLIKGIVWLLMPQYLAKIAVIYQNKVLLNVMMILVICFGFYVGCLGFCH